MSLLSWIKSRLLSSPPADPKGSLPVDRSFRPQDICHPLLMRSGHWKVDQPRLVVITGAGLSAPSGLQTFRRAQGLWNDHRIDEVCHFGTWARHRAQVHDFYSRLKSQCSAAHPNEGHQSLAQLPGNVVVATQNVDGLLERCSLPALCLHGQLNRCQCVSCGLAWTIPWEETYGSHCPRCQSHLVKPGVIFFHEPVPLYRKLEYVLQQLTPADAVAVVGTSGEVLPIHNWLFRCSAQKWLFNLGPEPRLDSSRFDRHVYGDFVHTSHQLHAWWNAHRHA